MSSTQIEPITLQERTFTKVSQQMTRNSVVQDMARAIMDRVSSMVGREQQRLNDLVASIADANGVTLPPEYDLMLEPEHMTLVITPVTRAAQTNGAVEH